MNFKLIILAAIIISCSSENQLFSQSRFLSFRNGEIGLSEQKIFVERNVVQSNTDGLELSFVFNGAYVSEKAVKEEIYQFINIEGLTFTGQTGAPALPVRNEIIAMPRGSTGKIEIIETEFYEYQSYNIHPVLELAKDTEGAPEPEFKKDEKLYSTDSFYPDNIVEITGVALNRNTPLSKLQIRPVQYNPVSKTIRVYTKVSLKITFAGGEGSFDYIKNENSLHYTNLLKLNVLNSDNIPDGIQKTELEKSESKDYIIITHSEFETQANQLANWKRQLGFGVEVISQSNWTPAMIKSAVEDRYDTWVPKPDYLLILGDHNGIYPVPGEIHTDPAGTETFATDLYYVCMDGSSDWHPDMAHGRISVSSSDEADVVINKIINYEKIPVNDPDFYNNILNCAQYQDDDGNGYADRRFCHTSEEIRDYLQNDHGYISERIYYTSTSADILNLRYNNGYYSNGELLPSELRDYSFNWNGGSNEILNAVNNGKFMVFHRDHGYVGGSGWAHPNFTTSTISNLSNLDKLPIVFSINCHTGEYQLSNCFSEKLLREANKGAAGVIGAAYYSYSGYNDALSAGMIDAIWADPGFYPIFGASGTGNNYTIGTENAIYTMGDVVNQGLYAMEQNFDGYSGSERYQYELFHYFGDPAMKIWTANPYDNIISADHLNEIDCNLSEFEILNSVPFAMVSLLFNDQLISVFTLDDSGNGTVPYNISEAGDQIKLTVSKHNYLTYIADLTVTGDCQFIPMVETYSAEAVTDNSANLFGEIIYDGGDQIIESGFVFSTEEDPFIGENGVIQVPTDPTIAYGVFNVNVDNLENRTLYFYKSYAENSVGIAYGNEDEFETSCEKESEFPLVFDFEDIIFFQDCWMQEYVSGENISWEILEGEAFSGNQYIYLYDNDSQADNTLLITPFIDISTLDNAYLTYWYKNNKSIINTDEFATLFRSSPAEEWIEINHVSDFHEDWTQVILELPVLSENVQIAFSGFVQYGNGISIDYIKVGHTVGINNFTEKTIKIFPNPATEYVNIEIPEAKNAILCIYNITGKKTADKILSRDFNTIDISNYKSGLYIIQIIQNEKTYYTNLIIK